MARALLGRLLSVLRRIPRRYLPLLAALCCAACGAPVGGDDPNVYGHQEALTAVYQINVGGGVLSPFAGDQYGNGGTLWTDYVTVSTAGVTNPAPANVYQSERYGNFSYTFGNLNAGASYTVRLHFAENHWTSVGARVFNVLINGSQVLTNFDIFASAGANQAMVREFSTTASSSGQITIQYVTVKDNAKASAIEILAAGGSGNAAPTVATAASANPNPTTGTTTALSVLGADDGGEGNLIYTWSTTGTPPGAVSFSTNGTNAAKNTTATFSKAGSYALSATIRDASGATATSNVTVTVSSSASTPVHQINVGGGALSPFAADQYGNGGSPWTDYVTVSTAGVTNPAPANVYQSERYGNFSYTFGNLTAGASYTVRLHFAENHWTSAGARVFNVLVNGSQVLTNFDIFANAGANHAIVREFSSTATSSGQITVQYVTVKDNAKASAIEILAAGGGSGNAAPTVATSASANPNPTTGTTTALSVLGADDGGEGNLIYTWSTTGTPPAAVSFSTNGTNAAKNTTATFSKAGSYALSATIRDASGATTTSNVNVTVNQKLTGISVSPASASVTVNGSQQFVGSATDQFGSAMTSQPALTWTVSGGGSINSSGLFTAGSSSGGPFTVSAASGGMTGTASVSVTSGRPQIGDKDSAGRTLVWADEFDGPNIDRSVWGNETGFVRNNELENYTTDPANQYIQNGNLVIKGIYVGGSGQGSYTSASLTTQGKKAFQYGRIEARIKIPSPTGSWPAFWMLPPNKGWPSGGEIDVMEWVSQNRNTVWGTAHYAINGGHQSSGGTINLSSPVPSDYHVFAIEWTSTMIRWFVDSNNYFTWNYAAANPPPDGNAFNGQFYLILGYAIGGSWPEAPDSSQYPGEMDVDWVRVWQ